MALGSKSDGFSKKDKRQSNKAPAVAAKKRKRSGREGGRQQQHFHFFKIILEDTLQSGKLVLPKKFIKKYKEELPHFVRLRVPTGDVWQMELQRRNGTVSLDKGWRNFASFYSLEYAHLLMFRYKPRTSEFQVLICDTTTTEINYPKKSNMPETSTPVIIEVSDDDDEDGALSIMFESESETELEKEWEIMETEPESSSLPSSLPSKRRMKNSYGKASCSRRRKAHNGKRTSQPDLGLVSVHPFFQSRISKGYLSNKTLSVPWTFVKNNLNVQGKEPILLTLETEAGSWQVNLCNYPGSSHARLSGGFSAFLRENSVELGDFFTFELIDRKKNLFAVSIDRDDH